MNGISFAICLKVQGMENTHWGVAFLFFQLHYAL